ncbi:MAG TPA: hypothetical protein VNL71_07215 [Chloroflexota bacterium]|nr:hypothetical protein [Chloroflexota bacterium]
MNQTGERTVHAFHTLAGPRKATGVSRPGRVVFEGAIVPGVTLIVRVEAVIFFLLLAVALQLLIMPWALDTHPIHTIRGLHGRPRLEHLTRHAAPLVQYAGTLAIVAATMAVTMAHELGHALALRRAGATDITITVYGAGGACRAQARDTSPLALFWYASAGPLVTIALVIGLVGIRMALPGPHDVRAILWLCAAIQSGILALNLLPILRRSDGGHMLRALAALWHGSRGAYLVVGAGLCLIPAALVGTLQGSTPAALLCGAVTVLLMALMARVAWVADRRVPRIARPAGPSGVITFW